ncbi:MAG: NADH-quinone oxidoreductase subunit N [Actinomycetota bacterium]|nr:NADH-quinone oxidoreductase subunit N [Actinomycetota bacterium]
MEWLQQVNWFVLAPELIIFSFAIIVLVGELFLSANAKRSLGVVTLIGLIASLASVAGIWNIETTQFNGMFSVDLTANILKAILLVTTSLMVLGALKSRFSMGEGEFFSLILFSVLGTMFMASSADLIMLFIALELTVLPAYVLTAGRRSARSSEAALKYFLLGIVASVILLYGMTLLFGLTGQTNFIAIAKELAKQKIDATLAVAMLMIIVGLGFKVAAVPFHFWAPDVYEGSPVPVATYLAAGPKAGGFAAIIHLFPVALASVKPAWAMVFAALAVLSMTVGNFVALAQNQIRRLLGYSAIAHTGYLLIGLAVADQIGYSSMIFYFFVYSLAALGAFLVVLATTERGIGESVTDFAGLHKRAPMVAFAMAVFLFSLVGLPPLAGFMGKLFLFSAAVKSNLIWLAVVAVLNSVVSFGYYVTVIRQMYLAPPVTDKAMPVSAPLYLSIMLIVAAIIVLGVYPTAFLSIINL